MILKKLISGLIVVLISLNFAMYPVDGESENLNLVHGCKEDSKDQNLDGNEGGKPACNDECTGADIDKQLLNFIYTIFTEDEINEMNQSAKDKSYTDLKKKCGCRMWFNKNYDCAEVYLCDEHFRYFELLHAPESDSENSNGTSSKPTIKNEALQISNEGRATQGNTSINRGICNSDLCKGDIDLENINMEDFREYNCTDHAGSNMGNKTTGAVNSHKNYDASGIGFTDITLEDIDH